MRVLTIDSEIGSDTCFLEMTDFGRGRNFNSTQDREPIEWSPEKMP